MVREIKETPHGTVYTKFSSSNQRLKNEVIYCTNTFEAANGMMICKGSIINNYCQKCGLYYGPGIDPRVLARRKEEAEEKENKENEQRQDS